MIVTIMSQNVQSGSVEQGHWPGTIAAIREVRPDILMLQEADWLTGIDRHQADWTGVAATTARVVASLRRPVRRWIAGRALGMPMILAPSRNLPVAVAWRADRVRFLGSETRYWRDLHHGYCAARWDVALPVPLVGVTAHLTPYSTAAAAQEAQLLIARAYRHGGLAAVIGDINHPPLGDPEPDWVRVQPYNRAARCLPRVDPGDPWRANPLVGQVLRDGSLIDVAGYLANQRGDDTLRAPTGRHGGMRVDQAHVTAALRPAIQNYWRVDPGEHSDHWGIVCVLDLSRVDLSLLRPYT